MSLPDVSVVIPARSAAGTIGSAVTSAMAQEYAGSIEVIVAHPVPDDGTAAAARAASPDVVLVANPSGRTPDALNAAIAAGHGEVVVRCDAHAVLPPTYVARAVSTLITTGSVNVGGIQAPVGRGFLQRAVAIAQSTPLGVGDARYRLGGEPGPVDTVYLGVFLRRAVDAVGGFDPAFERNQDYELNWRLREAGGTVWFDPELVVEYHPRERLSALARQYLEYGRWKRRMVSIHPRSIRARQLAAPLLVLGLGGSALLSASPWRPAAPVVPVAYLAALAATTLWELARRRDPAALALPVVIPVMHLSWGAGFLAPGTGDAPGQSDPAPHPGTRL